LQQRLSDAINFRSHNSEQRPETNNTAEAVSKGGSSAKIKAGDYFNHRHALSISRIEM
jgi:hypothetical protein